MANEFIIKHGFHSKGDSQVTGSLNVSDSLTVNGSAVGAAFPFTGDAQITGSLTISGSFEAFTLDSDNIVLGSGSGKLMQAGADSNVLIGTTLGQALTTGDQNVFIGTNAGNQVSTTTQNVFIGSSAGNTRTGTRNVALGDSAGSGTYNISANDLIAIGTYAGRNNAGSGNIAIGYYAMPTNAGSYSVALGYLSMGHNGGGAGNTAIGGYTLRYAPAASVHQVAVGTYAGQFSYGNGNILIGYKAGEYLQSNAHGNIIIGSGSIGNSGEVNQLRVGHTGSMTLLSGSFTTGDIIFANTASAPNFSGSFQGDGSNLTGVSAFPFTGDAQITGSLTISGSLQLDYNGVGNMIIGSGSGKVLESGGINNLIFGNNAATSLTTGDQNVIIGNRAGDSSNLNIESNNVYVGYEAGKDATHQASYGDNVFIGTQAGKDSKAQFSQFIGSNAGNGTAAFSTGIGHSNLSCTSEHSVAIGYQSQTNGTNHYNTSIGSFALQSNNGGANNERTVAIGYYAAQNSYNVDDGIYIGYYAGANVNTGQGNIVIGSGSLLSPANYQLRIGHADIHVISGSLTTGDVIFYNTASAPNFSGSFQGDGSNLTGTGTTVVGNSGTGDILDSITIGGTGFDVTTGTVTTTNGSSNRIATYNTTTQIDGSDNLTFDGSNLKVVGDTHMTGSLNISGSTTIELPTGTAFEILEGDKDQQSRLIFDYSNGDPTLTVASRASTAKMILRQEAGTNGLYLDEDGQIYVNNSTSDGVKVNGTTLASIGTNANALDLGSDTRPWKDLYLQLGGDIVYTTSNENMRLQHVNPNQLRISGSDGVAPSFNVLDGSITASVIEAESAFKLNDSNALSFSGNILYVGNDNNWTTVELGRQTTDEIHANGIFKAEQLLKAEQNAQITGSLNITGSNEIKGSGSGLFKVEGSVGTLFSVDDGLNDVIFSANNISGTPVISANADNTVKLGKLNGFGIVISGSTPAPTNEAAKIFITGSVHHTGSSFNIDSNLQFTDGLTNQIIFDHPGASKAVIKSDNGYSLILDADADGDESNTNMVDLRVGGTSIVKADGGNSQITLNAKTLVRNTSLTVGGTSTLSTTAGRIDATNDVVAFSTSDEKLKENITPIENALDKVSQVQGIEFDWIPKEEVHGNKGHDVGVIAQEIEKVLPEVVTTRDNGYKAVKYEKIIPLLVEAIKELQAEVQELKNNK